MNSNQSNLTIQTDNDCTGVFFDNKLGHYIFEGQFDTYPNIQDMRKVASTLGCKVKGPVTLIYCFRPPFHNKVLTAWKFHKLS